jgi:hypothetical protein
MKQGTKWPSVEKINTEERINQQVNHLLEKRRAELLVKERLDEEQRKSAEKNTIMQIINLLSNDPDALKVLKETLAKNGPQSNQNVNNNVEAGKKKGGL